MSRVGKRPRQARAPSRRQVLAASAGLLAAPHLARAATPADTDVVIIGAGAAGLAAARVLQKTGIGFELIEVRNRIGGRAHTDRDYFGVPVDFGCSELHNAGRNPWVGYARKNAIALEPLPGGNTVFDGRRRLTGDEAASLARTFELHRQRLRQACANGREVSVAEVLADVEPGPWSGSVRLWLGPISAGIDLEDWSLLDWCAGRAGENWYAPAGFGALIAHFGREIPVRLGTRAEELAWSASSVELSTDRGRLSAKAAIVTLPVPVLKDGDMRFSPKLPAWKRAALDGFASAHYTKVLLKFREDIFAVPRGAWVAYRASAREGFSFWVDPGGHGVTHAIAGGAFGRDLELAGADTAVDAALSALRAMLGSRVEEAFEEGTATVWSQDPYALGAWVEARPGHAASRAALLRPLGGRVFFAGEACHDTMPATAGGAAIVGDAVGRHLAGLIGQL